MIFMNFWGEGEWLLVPQLPPPLYLFKIYRGCQVCTPTTNLAGRFGGKFGVHIINPGKELEEVSYF